MTPVPARKPRKWLRILLAVLGVLVLARVAIGLWGRHRLQTFLRETEPAWLAERARLEGLRHPWEAAADQPCATAYDAASEVDLAAAGVAINAAVTAPPRARLSDDARAVVNANQPTIEAFLRGSRCGAYAAKAGEAWAPFERYLPLYRVARLVVLDARLRAEAGEIPAALDRLLAVAKSGTDMAEGTLVGQMVGASMFTSSMETLAPLIEDGRLSKEDRERTGRALAALAPRLPTLPRALTKERLHLHWAASEMLGDRAVLSMRALDGHEEESVSLQEWLLPVRAVYASAMPRHDAYFREASALAESQRDLEKLRAEVERLEPKDAAAKWTGLGFPTNSLMTQGRSLCVALAWHRLASSALALAQAGAGPDAIPAPAEDPCGPGTLAHSRSPGGRSSLASVGKDGVTSDDDPKVLLAPPPP